MPLTIQIWSDIACPWCWIGKRSLETALALLDIPVNVRWRAFELDPAAPRESPDAVDYADRLARKYGTTREQGQAFIDRMVAAGADRGLELRFDRIRPGNTFDAHRLLAWAREQGAQTELKERLFRAYLNEGRSVADHPTLVDLAEEATLDRENAIEVLTSDRFGDEVRQDQAIAYRSGIQGVPFFVFGDSGIAISGAQPPDVISEAVSRALEG